MLLALRAEGVLMPIYEYCAVEEQQSCSHCVKGFDEFQAMQDAALTACPKCGKPVRRVITAPNVSVPRSNSELKSQGFTKLVRRDKGVYENVTDGGITDVNQ